MNDTEALAEVLMTALCDRTPIWADRHIGELEYHLCDVIAEAVLASDWLAARVAAAHADALAPARRIDRHAIAAAIYSGGGAVHPDASDRVLALLRAAVAVPEPEEGWICDVCGCGRQVDGHCKYHDEHEEDTP